MVKEKWLNVSILKILQVDTSCILILEIKDQEFEFVGMRFCLSKE